jgi:hypothetical protein
MFFLLRDTMVMDTPKNIEPWKWKPGKSMNPGGRPKEVKEVKLLARKYTVEAIATLHHFMRAHNVHPMIRIQAANALLDRGYGKPAQDVQQPDNSMTIQNMDLTKLPQEDIDALMRIVSKANRELPPAT